MTKITKRSRILRSLMMSDDEGTVAVARQALQIATAVAASSKHDKLSKAATMVGTVVSIGGLAYQLKGRYKELQEREKQLFDIEVTEGPAYDYLIDIVRENTDMSEISTVKLSTKWTEDPRVGRRGRTAEVVYTFNEELDVRTEIGGHLVQVRRPTTTANARIEQSNYSAALGGNNNNFKQVQSLIIRCDNDKARADIMELMAEQVKEASKRKPSFFVSAKWGSFERVSDIPDRPKESVILKEGQMDRILTHLSDFLSHEEHYVKLGIPYRTGVLLSGNPGSGKSSTASAIAFELGLDVYFVSLSSISNDNDLISLMEDVPARSVVILEDIDVAKATKERTESDTGVTMSGLLNSLDGFTSPHGVITLMTTNKIESMDPAVVRPGRVDLLETIDELDTYQLRGICEHFLGFAPEDLSEITPEDGITSASLVGIIKKYIPNMEESADEVIEFVKERSKSFTK